MVNNRWPTNSNDAGNINCNHTAWVVIKTKWVASNTANRLPVTSAPTPAFKRGNNRIKYKATTKNTPASATAPHAGVTK